MSDFSFDIVGFDLDGTLFDTIGDLAAAVNVAITSIGRPALPVDRVREFVGGGTRQMLSLALTATGGSDDALVEQLYPILIAAYEADIAVHTRPFPGALDALNALAARGVQVALVTNKLEHLALRMLDAMGLRDRFATVIGGDTMGPGRAKPDRAPIDEMIRRCGGGRAAYVGDSRFDVDAARNAGVPVVVVSFGFRREPIEALAADADAVIDHFDSLLPALETIAA